MGIRLKRTVLVLRQCTTAPIYCYKAMYTVMACTVAISTTASASRSPTLYLQHEYRSSSSTDTKHHSSTAKCIGASATVLFHHTTCSKHSIAA